MRKIFPIEDRIYIAKYCEKIELAELAIGISTNTTIKDVKAEIERMKQESVYELYKAMPTEEYEEVCRRNESKLKRNKFFNSGGKRCQK